MNLLMRTINNKFGSVIFNVIATFFLLFAIASVFIDSNSQRENLKNEFPEGYELIAQTQAAISSTSSYSIPVKNLITAKVALSRESIKSDRSNFCQNFLFAQLFKVRQAGFFEMKFLLFQVFKHKLPSFRQGNEIPIFS
ncbi:MAG: hypothetical protein GY705_03305 [Bacteroidetes bacterium]|nr:hypothetical protein [Bacteroidota bacterium]